MSMADSPRADAAEAFDVAESIAVEVPPAEPAMTSFSLSDLGLSDDEIASLGLGEPAAPVKAGFGIARSYF